MTNDMPDIDDSLDSEPFEMVEPEERTVEIARDADSEEDETDD